MQMNALKMQRLSAGYTQARLSLATGYSQQLISRLEAGAIRMSPDKAIRFAGVLECEPADIMPALSIGQGEDEIEILRLYRNLDNAGQQAVLAVAHALELRLRTERSQPKPRAAAT